MDWTPSTPTEPAETDREDLRGGHREDELGELAGGFTDDEVAVVELERSWWKYPGAKEVAVVDRFRWTTTRYYQVLTRSSTPGSARATRSP